MANIILSLLPLPLLKTQPSQGTELATQSSDCLVGELKEVK